MSKRWIAQVMNQTAGRSNDWDGGPLLFFHPLIFNFPDYLKGKIFSYA